MDVPDRDLATIECYKTDGKIACEWKGAPDALVAISHALMRQSPGLFGYFPWKLKRVGSDPRGYDYYRRDA